MDEVRGFDLLLMVAFHGFYTAGYLFGFRPAAWLFNFFNPVEPFFAGLFILICGISCRLSHSNWKRGGLLLAVAAVMSAFLFVFMRKEMIWFGILHFLAVSILLFALCRPLLDKIPPAWGVAACAVLTLITWWVPGYRGSQFGIPGLLSFPIPESVQACGWLYPLGLGLGEGADYFPLLPWLFLFWAGYFLHFCMGRARMEPLRRSVCAPLGWLGRHSLGIYLLHQPVIYGVLLLLFHVFEQ